MIFGCYDSSNPIRIDGYAWFCLIPTSQTSDSPPQWVSNTRRHDTWWTHTSADRATPLHAALMLATVWNAIETEPHARLPARHPRHTQARRGLCPCPAAPNDSADERKVQAIGGMGSDSGRSAPAESTIVPDGPPDQRARETWTSVDLTPVGQTRWPANSGVRAPHAVALPFRLRRLERSQSVLREASAGREYLRATRYRAPASWRALQLQGIRRPRKPCEPLPRSAKPRAPRVCSAQLRDRCWRGWGNHDS